MPTLPTLTVTDAQATRILAVFGDVAAYREWLKEQVRAHVLGAEMREFEGSQEEARVARYEELNATLPAPAPSPPPPPPIEPTP